MISEIRAVTLGVADLDRAARFYHEAFGYQEIGRAPVDSISLAEAWRLPDGMSATYAVLAAPGATTGLVRLLQADAPGERVWGDYSRLQDLGHYAVNFRVRDIQAGWARLLAAGAVAKSAPTFWTVTDTLSAWDSQCFDPDGTLLDVFEVPGDPPIGLLHDEVSPVQTMALHVGDMARSRRFYESLGFQELYDVKIDHLSSFFGVDAALHNVNLANANPAYGRVELAQYIGLSGESLRDRAAPPNHGPLSITFETDDVDAALATATANGGTLASAREPVTLLPAGSVHLATVYGPDGELVEFYQPA